MLRVIGCLTESHDLVLVAVAAILCLLSSVASLSLLDRARSTAVFPARLGWLALAATTFGGGVWATHFVAMLAYDPGLPVAYEPRLTMASGALLVVAAGIVFGARLRFQSRRWVAAGGAALGLCVGLMHYLGMAAVNVAGRIEFDADLVISSLVIGAAISAAAMTFSAQPGLRTRLIATGLLSLSVVALHFTGMGAVQVWPEGGAAAPKAGLDRQWLAAIIASVAGAALLAAAAAAALEARLRAAASLAEAARMRGLADATFEGIAVLAADGTVHDANRRLADLLNRPLKAILGAPLATLLQPAASRDSETIEALIAGARERSVAAVLAAAEGPVPVEVRVGTMEAAGKQHPVLAVRDLRERLAAEARIAHMAHHDALTGLANRVLLYDRLDQALARARREGGKVAVLCLDLDRFKPVNDTLGHTVGDALLQDVATRLLRCVRETDTVARLGGDEFAIVQVGPSQPGDATALARRLIEELSLPYDVGGYRVAIGASVGISIAPDDADEPDALLRNADLALYRAKSDQRGAWCFFEPEMDARMQARRTLELDLRQALTLNQFELFYQPTVDLRTRTLRGFEALIRWRHPERGLVPPGDFIPLAEEIGLIVPIGAWVLRRACADAATWPGDAKVAVNLSPAQVANRGLIEAVSTALDASGLEPARLELEITETVMLKDTDATLSMLRDLKALGVGIAMDDFGTGYSSLSYLRRFPFDRVKIDRSFVEDLGRAGESTAIVRAVMALCENLGMATTAEGVETEEQLAHLSAALTSGNSMEVQGYLFSRPRPLAEVPAIWQALGGNTTSTAPV